ncbi:HAMP domain-containing histidine kinase [Nocardioides dongxiaopingii]|uniref:sensor histidine kinase n=1 Tax=Nocardioides sp. S-1144 TaxID=2582905 RepID=UPI00116274E9|nr:HAMP domain-containing sensor histidine kinase [Nocardioides sp. S-1144]QDH10916.1 HAMP domain-containing histidine kinase [Nocardioides sp. S-1144]
MSIDLAFIAPGSSRRSRLLDPPPTTVVAVAVVTVAALAASLVGHPSSAGSGSELALRWGQTELLLGAAVLVVLRLSRRRRADGDEPVPGAGGDAGDPDAPADLADLGAASRRALAAEAALGRDQERWHELRATVTGIALSHRLLHDGAAALPAGTQARLARMYDSEIGRLERLVSPAHDEDPASTVDLHDVIDPLVTSLEVRGHAVRWAGTARRVVARADDVAEMVHVLLENAVAHGSGREVAVEVVAAAGHPADPGGAERVHVVVSDHGPGVPPALAGRVFDRGVRGERSRGHGLGLNIAHRLAAEAGGRLWLEPGGPGSGATFVIDLAADDRTSPCPALSA